MQIKMAILLSTLILAGCQSDSDPAASAATEGAAPQVVPRSIAILTPNGPSTLPPPPRSAPVQRPGSTTSTAPGTAADPKSLNDLTLWAKPPETHAPTLEEARKALYRAYRDAQKQKTTDLPDAASVQQRTADALIDSCNPMPYAATCRVQVGTQQLWVHFVWDDTAHEWAVQGISPFQG